MLGLSSRTTRATVFTGTVVPSGVSIGSVAMRSKSGSGPWLSFTTRSNDMPDSKTRPTVVPANAVSIVLVTSSIRRPYRARAPRSRTKRIVSHIHLVLDREVRHSLDPAHRLLHTLRQVA